LTPNEKRPEKPHVPKIQPPTSIYKLNLSITFVP
jgi:hypothetical protein